MIFVKNVKRRLENKILNSCTIQAWIDVLRCRLEKVEPTRRGGMVVGWGVEGVMPGQIESVLRGLANCLAAPRVLY